MFSLSLILFRFFLIVSLEKEQRKYQFWYQLFWFIPTSRSFSLIRPSTTFLCCSSCGAAVVGLRPELSDSSAGHCTIGLFFPLCTAGLFFLTFLVHFWSLFLSLFVHYWSLFSDSFCALLISFFPLCTIHTFFLPFWALLALHNVYFVQYIFSAEPSKLRPILKFEFLFASACSSVRKIHFFFIHLWLSNFNSVVSP